MSCSSARDSKGALSSRCPQHHPGIEGGRGRGKLVAIGPPERRNHFGRAVESTRDVGQALALIDARETAAGWSAGSRDRADVRNRVEPPGRVRLRGRHSRDLGPGGSPGLAGRSICGIGSGRRIGGPGRHGRSLRSGLGPAPGLRGPGPALGSVGPIEGDRRREDQHDAERVSRPEMLIHRWIAPPVRVSPQDAVSISSEMPAADLSPIGPIFDASDGCARYRV